MKHRMVEIWNKIFEFSNNFFKHASLMHKPSMDLDHSTLELAR